MAKNKIVLFDIDYTLWDTKKYRELFLQSLAQKYGLDTASFIQNAESVYRLYMDEKKYFNPQDFAQSLKKHFDLPGSVEEITDSILEENIFISALFPDVEKTLTELKNRGYMLGVLSRGKLPFQGIKIASLMHLFPKEHIYILEEKAVQLPEILGKYQDFAITIVDDLPKILVLAKSFSPDITTIWIKQGYIERNLKDVADFQPDFTITLPSELLTILH